MKKVVKVLVLIRSLLLIAVMISIMNSYNVINQIKVFGATFYTLSFILMIIGIMGLLCKEHNMNKILSYNVIFILLELLIIMSAIVSNRAITMRVLEDMKMYFQIAYASFSFIIIGITLNTYILKQMKNTKKGLF